MLYAFSLERSSLACYFFSSGTNLPIESRLVKPWLGWFVNCIVDEYIALFRYLKVGWLSRLFGLP